MYEMKKFGSFTKLEVRGLSSLTEFPTQPGTIQLLNVPIYLKILSNERSHVIRVNYILYYNETSTSVSIIHRVNKLLKFFCAPSLKNKVMAKIMKVPFTTDLYQ